MFASLKDLFSIRVFDYFHRPRMPLEAFFYDIVVYLSW